MSIEKPTTTTSTWQQIRTYGPMTIIIVAAVIFLLQNLGSTKMRFLWLEFEMPAAIMYLLFGLIGAAVHWGMSYRRDRRARRRAP